MSSPSQAAPPPANPLAKQIKAELQAAAATLTAAVIGKMNVSVAADPTIKDAALQSLNVTAAQLHKIFYAFCDAAENNTGTDADGTINGWADPIMPVGAGSAPGGAVGLAGIPVAAILQFLAAQPPTSFAGLPATAVAALNNLAGLIGTANPPANPSAPAQVIAGT